MKNEKEMKIFPKFHALIRPFSVFSHRVFLKIFISFARVAALVAFVGFFYSVLALVLLKIVSVNGKKIALVTLVGFFSSVFELLFYEVSILNGSALATFRSCNCIRCSCVTSFHYSVAF